MNKSNIDGINIGQDRRQWLAEAAGCSIYNFSFRHWAITIAGGVWAPMFLSGLRYCKRQVRDERGGGEICLLGVVDILVYLF